MNEDSREKIQIFRIEKLISKKKEKNISRIRFQSIEYHKQRWIVAIL